MIKNILIFLFLFFLAGNASAQSSQSVPIPQFKQFVEDQTGTLTSTQLSELRQKLETFDKETSTQIVVYIISTLDGESLEDISMQLAEKNKIGKKDKNNGVLMLVVKDDRKIRIEVGYGLEGVLTDATSAQIIRKDITPYFKNGQYYEGINSGVDAIIAVSKGEYTADKQSSKDSNENDLFGTCCGLPIFVIIVFGIIFIMIVFSIISRIMGFGKSAVFGNKSKSNWYWGGGGGFGGGSSGFGGGGFSGGGGSFGGGGASGSW